MRRASGLILAALTLAMGGAALAQPADEVPAPAAPDPEPAPAAPAPDPEPAPAPDPEPAPAPVSGNAAIYAALPALELPTVDADTLAFGRTLEIVNISVDSTATGRGDDATDNEHASFSAAVASRYFQSLETRRLGWSVVATGADAFGRGPAAGGSLFTNDLALAGSPELRVYPVAGSQLFVFGAADLGVTISSTKRTGDVSNSDSNAPGALGVAIGAGFGRVLAIDPVVRLRRFEQALQAHGLLSGPIPEATGSAIVRTWYALRNDVGTYRTLAYTMKHLSEASLLTGDPDLRATYEALEVLKDPFIVNRRNGWEARGGLGVVQPFVGYDQRDEPDVALALLASAQYERPLDTTRQLSLRGKAVIELGDPTVTNNIIETRPYSLRAFAAYTQVFYDDTYDPLGSLAIAAEAGASGEREPDNLNLQRVLGLDIGGSVAYSKVLDRGSLATAAVHGSLLNDGTYSLTLSLGITWGVAAGYVTAYTPAAAGL
ncbi:MAG: hypothetical protein K8W52_17555 [Deltaproteobacteria bacterium]|nr:hypothetical protein [Deltaproteobacteria bacterium]